MDSLVEFYNARKSDDSTFIVSTVLSVAGFLFLSSKVFSFIRLLFSLFILPGKSVNSLDS